MLQLFEKYCHSMKVPHMSEPIDGFEISMPGRNGHEWGGNKRKGSNIVAYIIHFKCSVIWWYIDSTEHLNDQWRYQCWRERWTKVYFLLSLWGWRSSRSARILPAHPFSISFSNRIHEKSSIVQPFWFQPFICFRAVNSGSPLATRLFCLHMERIQTAWQNTTIHNMLQLWGQVFWPLHRLFKLKDPLVVSQSSPRRRSRYHCARSRPVFHTWIAIHFDFRRDDPEQKSGPISTSPNSICLLLIWL